MTPFDFQYENPNGALSSSPAGILDPRAMALFGLAQGLFKAGAPSPTPVGFGQALGMGLQGGMQGGIQGMQMAQQEAYRQAQMKQMVEKAELDRLRLNAPKVVPPGGALVGPDNKPVFSAPFKPADPKESPVAALIRERDALPVGHPNRVVYDDVLKKASMSQPAAVVNVDTKQETEFSKKVGAELGEQYAGLMKADMNAPATIGKYQRLSSILSQVNTGKFKGTTTDLKAAAKSLGMDLGALGITDDVAPAQAARALSNQLALELRNPAGGAGMPGALSDKDREFLLQSIPGLENDPAAIGKMIEYRVKIAQREQQVAKKAREYRRKHGKFDEGFFDELQDWSDKNPLFPDVSKPSGREGWSIRPKQ